jgi:hypothetical protein
MKRPDLSAHDLLAPRRRGAAPMPSRRRSSFYWRAAMLRLPMGWDLRAYLLRRED